MRLMGCSYFKLIHVWSMVLLVLLGAATHVFAEVRGYVDRHAISAGETVQFTLEAAGSGKGDPDTTTLEKEFDILGTSNSNRIEFVNGKMESHKSWIMTLRPKRSGTLIIPAISIGDFQSDLIELTVSKTPSSIHDANVDIFIETDSEPDDLYIQQQLIYRVRLFYGPSLKEGTLSDPTVDNAVVKRLGKDVSYDAEKNGKRYRVNERTYALFFQASGEQRIAPPVFEGKVIDRSRRSSRRPFGSLFDSNPFGMVNSMRMVSVQGDEQVVNVKARPDDIKADFWLPAELIELEEKWDELRDEYSVGEPITRTLTITAKGLTGAQLPDLIEDGIMGFKVYPDKAEIISDEILGTILGKRVQKVAYIAEQSGELVLPAVTLQWFNVRHQELRTVKLAERKIKVKEASDQQNPAPVSGDNVSSAEAGKTTVDGKVAVGSIVDTQLSDVAAGHEKTWKIVALFAVAAWLVTCVLLVREKKAKSIAGSLLNKKDTGKSMVKASGARFRSVCKSGDPQAVRNALLLWGSTMWTDNPPKGLVELGVRLGDEKFLHEMTELDSVLYGFGDSVDWSAHELMQCFDRVSGKAGGVKAVGGSVLPELYPDEAWSQKTG